MRTTRGSGPASARPRRRPRRASGSSGWPAGRSTTRRARSPRSSAASSCPRRRRRSDWGSVLATVGERPRHPRDLPARRLRHPARRPRHRHRHARRTGGRSGSELGWLDRWRLRRQARALLRPGRPPADLHAALAAASEQRVAWRELAGSGGRPEIPVELDRARVAHAALVDDLSWLDDRLPPPDGAEPAGDPSGARLVDLDLASLRTRVDELAAAAGRLGVAPAVTAALDGLTASGLRPLVDDLRARAVPAERATSEVEWVWWSSLAEEIALRDPRVAAHDGRALTPQRRRVRRGRPGGRGRQPRARGRSRRRPGRRGRARAPRAGDLPAGGGGPGPPARRRCATSSSRCPELVTAVRPCWVMSPLVVASVLPPGQLVRRRRLRRGLAGAAGRGRLGDLARPPGRRGRGLAPAAADLVLHHRHRR